MSRPSPARSGRRLLVVLLATAMLATLAPVTVGAAPAGFRFDGRGWGHGVGMSQYGALEQAKAGRTATDIVKYYYRGAGTATPDLGLGTIRIGIEQGTQRLTLRAMNGKTIVKGFGDASDLTVPAGQTRVVIVHASDGRCHLKRPLAEGGYDTLASADTCASTLTWGGQLGLSLDPVTSADKTFTWYGHGVMRLIDVDVPEGDPAKFHLVNQLPDLDTYLYGLAEVPSSWPTAALRAQAIAGRSYAAHKLLGQGGLRPDCACHLYDDVRSQVYRGLASQTPPWRSAVDATRGRVVYAPGEPGTEQGVVQAFYSSSSGGRTEAADDYFNTSPLSYLRSVDDPWSLRASNGNANWTATLSEAAVRDRLGGANSTTTSDTRFDSVASLTIVERNESGTVRELAISGTRDGQPKTVSIVGPSHVRSILGLKSAHVTRIFLPPFIDDDGSPFEADIAWIANEGITLGCNPPDNDRFCPTGNVSRGQMAAFLVRALDLTETSGVKFDDVPADHPFAEEIDKVYTAGITDGCGDGSTYCPGKPIPRDQMAAFLAAGLGLTATSADGEFEDVPADHFFAEQINQVATAGITRGCNQAGTKFCPRGEVLRGEMAAFLARALRDGA